MSPARLGTQSSSGATRLKLYRPLLTLHSVSLYLPLIGFNERFNNTALPDQIKLLLSAALNPGSLPCNACKTQDSPFCKIPPTSLLGPASHLLPTPRRSCLFLLMSTLSKPEQAVKPPVQKLHQFSHDWAHSYEDVLGCLLLSSGCDHTYGSK